MRKEAHFRKHRHHEGVWQDGLQYAILIEEWQDRSEAKQELKSKK